MYYLFDLVVNRCGNNVIRVQHKGDIVNPVQDLPDTIHIGGRISPSTVWDYVGKLKTSLSKVKLFTMRYLYTTYFLVEDPKVTPLSLFASSPGAVSDPVPSSHRGRGGGLRLSLLLFQQ